MKIIAIETATEACSAALYIDGEVRHISQIAPRQHAELILGMCGQLLDEAGLAMAELDGIGFGRGPGAFTGVRIATGVAQGLAWAADLPVVPVSSLAALAQGAYRQHMARYILTAIDARMDEVYAAAYAINDDGIAILIDEERVCAPDKLVLPGVGDNWFGAGSGWQTHEAPLHALCAAWLEGYVADSYPQAQDIAVLAAHALKAGQYVDAAHALPVYLRNNVAAKKAR